MNHHIERLNYYSDYRVTAEHHSLPLTFTDDDGNEHNLPHRWEVCPTCNGAGNHVNPSIDAGGLTAEDFDDEEFANNYFKGVYNVSCNECHGRSTVPVVNENACDPELYKQYENQREEAAHARQIKLAERRMGA